MCKYRNMKEMILSSLDIDNPEICQSRSRIETSPGAVPEISRSRIEASPFGAEISRSRIENSPSLTSYQKSQTQTVPRVPLLDFNDLTNSQTNLMASNSLMNSSSNGIQSQKENVPRQTTSAHTTPCKPPTIPPQNEGK